MSQEIIQDLKSTFKDHIISFRSENEHVQKFVFRRPNTGCYGFNLVCSDNLIALNGDIYSLVIEPGYGRSGLAFLRGSVRSTGYFLSKCPFRKELTEYSRKKALDHIKYYFESDYLTEEQHDDFMDRLTDEGEYWDERSYYELCHEFGIEEPMNPKTLTHQTLLQLAGLECFVEAYEKELQKAPE